MGEDFAEQAPDLAVARRELDCAERERDLAVVEETLARRTSELEQREAAQADREQLLADARAALAREADESDERFRGLVEQVLKSEKSRVDLENRLRVAERTREATRVRADAAMREAVEASRAAQAARQERATLIEQNRRLNASLETARIFERAAVDAERKLGQVKTELNALSRRYEAVSAQYRASVEATKAAERRVEKMGREQSDLKVRLGRATGALQKAGIRVLGLASLAVCMVLTMGASGTVPAELTILERAYTLPNDLRLDIGRVTVVSREYVIPAYEGVKPGHLGRARIIPYYQLPAGQTYAGLRVKGNAAGHLGTGDPPTVNFAGSSFRVVALEGTLCIRVYAAGMDTTQVHRISANVDSLYGGYSLPVRFDSLGIWCLDVEGVDGLAGRAEVFIE